MSSEPLHESPTASLGGGADDERELAAAQELHRRIQRTRKRASLTCLLSGLLLGAVLVAALQGPLATALGGRFGTLALVGVFFAPLLAALKVAELVAEAVVGRRVGEWTDELARQHNVPTATLADHARIAGVGAG